MYLFWFTVFYMTYKKTWYPNLYVQVSLEKIHPYRAKEDEGLLQIVIFHAYTTDIPKYIYTPSFQSCSMLSPSVRKVLFFKWYFVALKMNGLCAYPANIKTSSAAEKNTPQVG